MNCSPATGGIAACCGPGGAAGAPCAGAKLFALMLLRLLCGLRLLQGLGQSLLLLRPSELADGQLLTILLEGGLSLAFRLSELRGLLRVRALGILNVPCRSLAGASLPAPCQAVALDPS